MRALLAERHDRLLVDAQEHRRIVVGGIAEQVGPADRDVGWGDASIWPIAVAVGAAVARVVAERGAAAAWAAAVGSPPPDSGD